MALTNEVGIQAPLLLVHAPLRCIHSHGHYFEGNYHAAKEDFAVRSGLISRAQLFSADQLAELYRATDFFLEEGPEPEDKQMKALQEARTKIEYTVPDLQERLELSQEPEMNL